MKRIVLMISGIILTTSFTFSQGNLNATLTASDGICIGYCTGSIDVVVNGGTPPYSYIWSNGDTIEDLSNLCNDNYYITITDFAGDTIQSSATITSPVELTCIISDDQIICSGDTVTLTAFEFSGGECPYSYYWNNVPSSSIIHVSPDSTTTYSFRFSDAMGSHSDTSYVTVFVQHYPITVQINIVGNELNSNSYCGNQWYYDTDSIPDFKNKGLTSTLIPGAIEQQYTPTETGYYFDIITDNIGNELISNVVYFTYNNNDIIGNDNALLVYPNPTKDFINIDLSKTNEKSYKVMICNIYGQLIDEYDFKNEGVNKISVNKLKSGLYVIKVKTNLGEINRKVMINE